nr:MAG TPA: TRAP Tryptophan RNA-binding attenuator protein inhibitory protein [Caudoviricetes sp.]
MKIENEKELFELVCDTAAANAKYNKPFLNKEDGNVWATDGRILLIINPECLEQKYAEDSLKVTVCVWESTPKVVRLEAIEKALQSCPLVEKTISTICDECGGQVEVWWTYKDKHGKRHDKDWDCPICYGEGIKSHATGQLRPDPYSILKLGEAYFRAEYIEKLKRCMRLLDSDYALLTANSPLGASVFQTDNAKIMLMPYLISEESNEEICASVELEENESLAL